MFLAKVGGALVRGSKSAGPMVVPLRNVARVRGLDNVKIPDLKAMPRIKVGPAAVICVVAPDVELSLFIAAQLSQTGSGSSSAEDSSWPW